MLINTIDAPMGAGKTTGAINMIKTGGKKMRYIYVTPYLSEIDRVKNELRDFRFCEPDGMVYGTKKLAFDHLVRHNRNIVTTHALFDDYLDAASFDGIAQRDYTLIMDEVSTPVTPLQIYQGDVKFLKSLTAVDDQGFVSWTADTYVDTGGKFSAEKKMIEAGNVVRMNDYNYVAIAPVRHFSAFKAVYLMTYMFDCQIQKYYFDLCGSEYRKLYVRKAPNGAYSITDVPTDYGDILPPRELLRVYEGKYNDIGDERFSLSKNWYIRNEESGARRVGNNCRSFFRKVGAESDDAIWTTYHEYQAAAAPHGYRKGFLPCNMRATNKYRMRTAVAYPINIFPHVSVKAFFAARGITVDDDKYALSEMLQFIWRSAVRDGKPVDVYVPSSRMRGLLKEYLEGGGSDINTGM